VLTVGVKLMHRSFVESDWLHQWLLDHQCPLPKDASQRFLQILRVKEGEQVALFDGQGRELRGLLKRQGSEVFMAEAELISQVRPRPEIVILQAALEESKISETIKRGTEFGASKFIIFSADRSESYLIAKLKKRNCRLEKIAVDACRQSGRLFMPSISIIDDLDQGLAKDCFGVFGDLSASKLLSKTLLNYDQNQDFVIAVGPEGGLSEREQVCLKDSGFKPVLWSPFTLRSELAALAALSLLHAHGEKA